MTAVQSTEIGFDLKKLFPILNELIRICSFYQETDQISLRHRPEVSGSDALTLFQDGIGSLYDFTEQDWLGHEQEFTVNHPLIEGTYLQEVSRVLLDLSHGRMGRFRIMRLKPKSCYTWHRDPDEKRLHIPIITNPSCFFLTEEGGLERMTEAGRLYWVKTKEFHTAVNASLVDRVHLVASTY